MDVDWRGTRPLILLAEDEAIIAVELQESLSDSGFSVAGPFATCAEAEAWLKTGTPDAAILDHALKDGPCDELAADLSRRGVPTLIFTGHDAPREMLADLHAATWITKPVAFPELLSALRRQIGAQA
jgi:DNA-binding response OmpR family regulator